MTLAAAEQLVKDSGLAEKGLPTGWVIALMGHLVNITSGKFIKRSEYSQTPDKPYPVAGAGGPIGWTDRFNFKAPIMTLGRVGAAGALNLYQSDAWVTDNALVVQTTNKDLFDLFALFFRTVKWADLHTGSSQPLITQTLVKKLLIPLPPLNEQKRIVAKVEQLLARVNAVRERLAKVPTVLKRFRQSVLAAACSGRLTADWREENSNYEAAARLIERIFTKREEQFEVESKTSKVGGRKIPQKPAGLRPRKIEVKELPEIPEQWAWVYLPDLGYMGRGKSRHRPRNAPHLYGGPYPFIQTGDIAQSGGRITSHQQTYSEKGLAQSRLWPDGTVCITIAANIASSAILTYPACFPDSVVGVNPDEDLCLAEYVEFFIRTARADLDQFAPATAQKNINIGILHEVAVPLPPFFEQQDIVRRVEALLNLANTIEKRVAVATTQAEKLAQAILAKAFRGELVPTEAKLALREGRSYEPASALLAKIEVQRKDAKPQRKRTVSRRQERNK